MSMGSMRGGNVWISRSKKLSYKDIPTVQELQFHLGELYQSNAGGRLDLSFSWHSNPYVLILEYKRSIGITNWKLYGGNTIGSNLLWENNTSDAAVIHNMIMITVNETLPTGHVEKKVLNNDGVFDVVLSAESAYSNIDLMSNLQKFLSEVQHETVIPADNVPQTEHLIDLNIGRDALQKLLLDALGVLSYPALLFCLIREYATANDNRSPLSVALIRLTLEERGKTLPVPRPILIDILDNIKKMQRKTDVIGQYDLDNTFAVILPETDLEGGKYFVSRIKGLLLKFQSPQEQKIKLTAAVSVASGFCNGLPTILGAAEQCISKLDETGEWLGTFANLFPNKLPPSKSIDFNLVQDLAEKLIAKQYGVFSLPILVALIEHEHNRAKRDRKPLHVLLISLVCDNESANQSIAILEEAMILLAARIGSLQNNSSLLAQYDENSFAVLLPKALPSALKNFAKQIIGSITDKPLSADSTIRSYNIESQVCVVSIDKNNADMAKFTPLD